MSLVYICLGVVVAFCATTCFIIYRGYIKYLEDYDHNHN